LEELLGDSLLYRYDARKIFPKFFSRGAFHFSSAANSTMAPVTPRAVSFREDRNELLSPLSPIAESPGSTPQKARKRRRTPSSKSTNNTASEAADIQQSLSRTQSLLQYELDRVSHVASAIDSDGKLLEDTMNDQQTMDVSSAKSALTALERAQQWEHRVLVFSVVFFWTAVFYVMWCRILIRIPFVDRILDLF
jgi:hypothetical protein